ncbi:porin [Photobacterium chitinilyticum]|uniref:Porin n=1 Tax=Photobacterium chitinilyticum TaxID=2485123 RepID=A0A444JTQ7_9GAMM|nr:porin [Photobacterium chitinilyticum]RWX56512.1 porin [Photobacterium chitinilyticum]
MEKGSKLFKVSALTAAMFGVLALPVHASSESAAGDKYVEAVNEFMKDSALNATFVVDTRTRTRNRGNVGDDVWSRFDYGSYNAILDFSSGYHDGWLGADVGAYFSGDLYNSSQVNGDTDEYLCNEISTCNNLDWGSGEGNPLKVYKAALKFKATEEVDGRFGMLQSGGNGTIGNVWSFVPGTYRGFELNGKIGDFTLSYFGADQYTAPWILHEDDYAPTLWADTTWSYLHSLGFSGNVNDDLYIALGVGQATNVVYATDVDWDNSVVNGYSDKNDNTSYRAYTRYTFNDTTTFAFDFYGVTDDVQYDGLGYHAGLSLNKSFDKISWTSELRYTDTKNGAEFVPRTIQTYGSNNGTWSQWWDALSDWNQDGELAWYNRVAYDAGNGWNYYAGFGYGTGADEAKNGQAGSAFESEYAVNGTVSYSLQSGSLKGSTVRLHGTYLVRDEFADQNVAGGYDETDLRFQVLIPYSFN